VVVGVARVFKMQNAQNIMLFFFLYVITCTYTAVWYQLFTQKEKRSSMQYSRHDSILAIYISVGSYRQR
jgi:hypothetical protein